MQTVKRIRERALSLLLSGLSLLLKEKIIVLAKILLPHLPYGKSVAIASIILQKFPTTTATRVFYSTGRPRWRSDFVFKLNPYCPLSKLFALTGLYQPVITAKLRQIKATGQLVDVGANFGYFAVLWLSNWQNEVLAIEPIRENHELLTANLARFKDRAKTLMCCLGEQCGEVVMSYNPDYPMLRFRVGNSVLRNTGSRLAQPGYHLDGASRLPIFIRRI